MRFVVYLVVKMWNIVSESNWFKIVLFKRKYLIVYIRKWIGAMLDQFDTIYAFM